MTPIAYLYLPTPSPENVAEIFESILASGVSISHFGRNDPPKKWNGDTQAMARLVLEQPELNKCVFMRDKTNAIELTVELFYDPRWSHSTIFIGRFIAASCYVRCREADRATKSRISAFGGKRSGQRSIVAFTAQT
ncbi:MAG: hypothetical protein IPH08_11110 [Rhodocyclaceae bacterium]|nr:hypothetical protein [Rhodocyclaceae bacterium]